MATSAQREIRGVQLGVRQGHQIWIKDTFRSDREHLNEFTRDGKVGVHVGAWDTGRKRRGASCRSLEESTELGLTTGLQRTSDCLPKNENGL